MEPETNRRWMEAMLGGDFEAAARETLALMRGLREEPERNPNWDNLLWDGKPLNGRHVLVRCNHGLGDTIQYARFLPALDSIARRLTVFVQPDLLPLLESMPGMIRNGCTESVPPSVDCEVEIMELSYAMRTTAFPRTVPYLPVELIARQGGILPPIIEGSGLNVGLIWAANDTERSVPTPDLLPLGDASGANFFSLQQGAETSPPFPAIILSPFTSSILDTAAAMLRMDLIITVDTMAAHLAGALGRPTWLLLNHNADARWMRCRSDSPWYPTVRLFRQTSEDNWLPLMTEVAEALDLEV